MKIFFAPYQLIPLARKNKNSIASSREGALLRIEQEGEFGYADLHPWREFGDAPLKEQLQLLQKGQLSQLARQSLWLAERDLSARGQSRNLLQNAEKVRNNFLVTRLDRFGAEDLQQVQAQGFTSLKLKVGRSIEAEKDFLQKASDAGLRLRLDFNSLLNFEEFQNYISALSLETRQAIEYVEDPFPFQVEQWTRANELIPLAIDHEISKYDFSNQMKPPFQVIVLKPAKTSVEAAVECIQKWQLKMTVTSYLDHAVGVMHALSVATELKEKFPNLLLDAGCMTLDQYEQNDFSQNIAIKGPFIQSTAIRGIGFDQQLEQRQWISLNSL